MATRIAAPRMPAYFLEHGGGALCVQLCVSACRQAPTLHFLNKPHERAGPLPLLGDPGHKGMGEHLKSLAKSLPEQPRALVVVSPHWEVRHKLPAGVHTHPCRLKRPGQQGVI